MQTVQWKKNANGARVRERIGQRKRWTGSDPIKRGRRVRKILKKVSAWTTTTRFKTERVEKEEKEEKERDQRQKSARLR